jgi:erythronate-4-phosphate dehydrogenase
MDIPYLEQAGIRWCFAPGCNANSVSEYVTAALLCLGRRHGIALHGLTMGVIGVGNVGSRVVRKARALGIRVLMNDPPRERGIVPPMAGGGLADLEPGPFVSLARVLAESDILTVHVPLTKDGPDRTYHLADRAFFGKVRKGCVFLNAARGAIVDTAALLEALHTGQVGHAVLDTWEGEPRYRTDILARVALGTPHIAGYSFEGKVMGTVMVYREACRFLGVEPAWTHEALMPPPPVPEVVLDAGLNEQAALDEAARRVYDIEADDRRFRETAVHEEKQRAALFDRLRREYPERREFPSTRVTAERGDLPAPLRAKLTALGFLRGLAVAVAVLTTVCACGCATVFRGRTQKISVTSDPPGAQVKVGMAPVGVTPIVVDLRRKRDHTVTVELPGYQTCQFPVEKELGGEPQFLGNLLLGPLFWLVFMVSADADRSAIEHSSWRNGAFTHCLLDGLRGKADGFQSAGRQDGIVTLGELRSYLATAMPEETEKVLGAARHPLITTSSGDPDIWNLVLQGR